MLQKLGAVPQQIAGGDIYPALEKGTIDAAEWVGPYDDEKLGFVQGRAALLLSRLVGRRPDALGIRQPRQMECAAEVLSGDLEQAGSSANNWMMAKYDMVNPPALRRLLANGTKLHGFSPPIMEASFKAAKELHSEIAATNEFQEGLRFADHLLEQRISVVPGRGSRLRQFHGAPLTELRFYIINRQSEKPGAIAPGFSLLRRDYLSEMARRGTPQVEFRNLKVLFFFHLLFRSRMNAPRLK